MGGHSFHPCDVRVDELLPATASVECGSRILRRRMLLHLDSQGKELPADGHQRGSGNPLLGRVIETFWLTFEHFGAILHTYTKRLGAEMKSKIGMLAVLLGIVGAGFGMGGVENSITTEQLIASIGVAATSLMLMYLGTVLINDEA